MEHTAAISGLVDVAEALGALDDLLAEIERRRADTRDRPDLEPAKTDQLFDHKKCVGLPEVLTVEEVAQFLRLNIKTVHQAIADRQLPGRKVGRRTVVLRDALLSWLSPQERVLPRRGRSNR